MAAPPNTTPGTAVVIEALPYTVTLDVSEAPEGTGYQDSCFGTQRQAVWYAYTAVANDVALSCRATYSGDDLSYVPVQSVFVGTPPDVQEPDFNKTCRVGVSIGNPAATPGWLMFPATVGTTYYFQICNYRSSGTPDADVTFRVVRQPALAAPSGSIVITDDTVNYPPIVLDASDGTPVRLVSCPVTGEQRDCVPGGNYAWQLGTDTTAARRTVAFLNAQLALITSVVTVGNVIRAISTDRDATFYVAFGAPGVDAIMRSYSKVGVATGDAWTLPDSGGLNMLAIARDGSTAYYGNSDFGATIQAYDLVNDAALPDVVTIGGGLFFLGTGDGFAASDGSIVAAVSDQTIRRYDPSGTLLNTYTVTVDAVTQNIYHYTWASDSPDTMIVWTFDADGSGVRYVTTIELDAMTPTVGQFHFPTMGTSGWPNDGSPQSQTYLDTPFAPSDSCHLALLTASLPPVGDVTFAVDCENDTLVLTGAGLTSSGLVITGPSGDSLDYTVESESSTEIVLSLDAGFTAGTYCADMGDQHVCATLFCQGGGSGEGTVYQLRRSRAFVLPFDQNYITNMRRLEVLIKSGVGNSEEPDPTLTVEVSRDGGETWSTPRTLAMGEAGDYMKRLYSFNFGQFRIGAARVTCSDPVFCGWLECYATWDDPRIS